MNYKDVRKGVSQAEVTESGSMIFLGEIILASIVIGMILSSWAVFGGSLLLFLVLTFIRKTRVILMISFTICWPILIWIIINDFGGTLATKVIFAILGFVIATGVHLAAFEWTEDLSHEEAQQ